MPSTTDTHDIGSIFPLYDKDLEKGINYDIPLWEGKRVLYSLCREALFDIALRHACSNKVVLLPAYTCMTVATPFIEQGWHCYYYSINKELRIEKEHITNLFKLHNPAIVVAHPFFGMDFTEAELSLLESLKAEGCTMVIDLTQCVFSKQRASFVDYYVGSVRKWMAMPDGGFLEAENGKLMDFIGERDYNTSFSSKQTYSMYLRGLYFTTGNMMVKEISRRMNQDAVISARIKTQPHRMDKLSYSILKNANIREIEQCRLDNFRFLYESLKGNNHYQPVCHDINTVTTAPLYFTIYVNKRAELQKTLAASQIYAPIIWPIGCNEMRTSEDVEYIYQHILAIPCDQRYTKKDMLKITNIINHFK